MKSKQKCYYAIAIIVVLLTLLGCSGGKTVPESQRLDGPERVSLRSANIDLGNKLYDKALENYLSILESNSKHIEVLKKVADIHFMFAEEKPAEAILNYETAFNYYERTIAAYDEIKHLGNFPDLADMIKDAQLKRTACWARIFNIGQKEFTEGIPKSALETFYKLSEMTPDSTKIYVMLATIYQTEDEDEKAAEYFYKITEKDESDIISRKNLAAHYYNRQEYDKAINWYKEVVKIDQDDLDAYYMMGDVYIMMNEYDEALEAFEQVIAIDENSVDAIITAANICFNFDMTEKAIYYYKKAVELLPDSKDTILYLLYALNKAQNYEDMLVYGEKLHKLDSSNLEAVQFIVLAAQNLNNKEMLDKYLKILQSMQK